MNQPAASRQRTLEDLGLAAGEPPVRRGFPPSVFRELPRLIERSGTSAHGSITAIYTVLVAGDEWDDPVAEEVRALLDGHIVLSRDLAHRSHWPAIDVLRSTSRVMHHVVDGEHREAAMAFRRYLSAYERHRDLIRIGAYQYGTDAEVDRGVDEVEEWLSFLQQATDESSPFLDTIDGLMELELL